MPPTLIEPDSFDKLKREVFDLVLHVVHYNRSELDKLVEQASASGYDLTLGVHTRIDETIAQVTDSTKMGNLYVNHNAIDTMVDVQSFGGEGLSDTDPKADDPLYLYRLLSSRPQDAVGVTSTRQDTERSLDAQPKTLLEKPLQALQQWTAGRSELRALRQQYGEQAQSGTQHLLPGPTGERNTLALMPRNRVLYVADNEQNALIQLAAALTVGCGVLWPDSALQRDLTRKLPREVNERIRFAKAGQLPGQASGAVIYHGDSNQPYELCERVAARDGTVVSMRDFAHGETNLLLERLYIEHSLGVNTTATGGNASPMTTG